MMKRTLFVLVAATVSLQAQTPFDRLLHADREPQNWLTYSGGLAGQRYSPLTQITRDNVKTLEQQWIFQARSLEKFEATPLVVDGIMYTVQAPNDIVALDAVDRTNLLGVLLRPSPTARPCCGRINRGVAILGDTLVHGNDRRASRGRRRAKRPSLWDTPIAQPEAGYSLTVSPLVVKDKVIVGTAGGEYGIRGFLAAFDAKTGKERWRFYTIAGPGEPGNETWSGESWKHGGGSIWVTGAYDPDLNLTYWGTGNAGPDWNGDVAPRRQPVHLFGRGARCGHRAS